MREWADKTIGAPSLFASGIRCSPVLTSFWFKIILLYLAPPFILAMCIRAVVLIMRFEYKWATACFEVEHIEISIPLQITQ